MLGSDWILTTYISSIQRRLVLDTRGLPVAGAQVMVEGVDKVTVTSERGEYWRLLLPGHYKSVLNTNRPIQYSSLVVTNKHKERG